MKGNMEQRACDEAVYIIECRGTVRDAARKFGISKSTVHKDISQRLPLFNRSLYLQVKAVLEENNLFPILKRTKIVPQEMTAENARAAMECSIIQHRMV